MIGSVWLYHGKVLQVDSFYDDPETKLKMARFQSMGTEYQPCYVWAEFLKEAFRLHRADTIV